MAGALTQLWYGKARSAVLLQPLAWLYAAITGLRRRAYALGIARTHDVGCPVVVVGNLVVGGSGKTPLVAWLAGELKSRGFVVGIVSRGYGRQEREARLVATSAPWQEVGDEPLLLAQGTGCITAVGADRVAAARLLVAHGANVIVSDDGLQHLRLAQHFRIIVVDGARGFGNGRLLPAGPLREPIAALGGADAVLVNEVSPDAALLGLCRRFNTHVMQMQLAPSAAVSLAGMPGRALESFRAAPVHAVAGIGNPARFFRELRAAGLAIIEHAFADHHPFAASELAFGDDRSVLMTEKDAVKCRGFADARMWYVPVAARLCAADSDELMRRIVMRLEAYRR